MTLYDAMFSQYGVSIAQILVTMSDFQVRDEHVMIGDCLIMNIWSPCPTSRWTRTSKPLHIFVK